MFRILQEKEWKGSREGWGKIKWVARPDGVYRTSGIARNSCHLGYTIMTWWRIFYLEMALEAGDVLTRQNIPDQAAVKLAEKRRS
mgnify:CR=1 FL=1